MAILMREKPRLKNARETIPREPLQKLEGPQKASSPLDVTCLSRKSSPWLAQKGPLEHRAGRPGSLGPGKRLPQLATWLPLGALHAPKSQDGRNPSHLVPLAQTHGLGEAQSKATSLPPSRAPHLSSGWSSSSSGSLGRVRRGDRAQDDGPCWPVCLLPMGVA